MIIYFHILKFICERLYEAHHRAVDGDGMMFCTRCSVSLNDEHKSLGWLDYNYFPYAED